jgi:hypothetical protein
MPEFIFDIGTLRSPSVRDEIKTKLISASASTIDRLPADVRSQEGGEYARSLDAGVRKTTFSVVRLCWESPVATAKNSACNGTHHNPNELNTWGV